MSNQVRREKLYFVMVGHFDENDKMVVRNGACYDDEKQAFSTYWDVRETLKNVGGRFVKLVRKTNVFSGDKFLKCESKMIKMAVSQYTKGVTQ